MTNQTVIFDLDINVARLYAKVGQLSTAIKAKDYRAATKLLNSIYETTTDIKLECVYRKNDESSHAVRSTLHNQD